MSILLPTVATSQGSAFVSIREFIKPFQKDRSSYTFLAEQGGVFTSDNGICYTIPPSAFTTRWGRALKDEITLQILEVRSKRNLFFLGKSSLSNNQLLDVDLAINLHIPEQIGKGIFQQLPIRCEVQVPKQQRVASLQLFEENISKTKSIFSEEEVDWSPSPYSVLIEKSFNEKTLNFSIRQMGTVLLAKHRNQNRKLKNLAMFSVEVSPAMSEMEDLQAFLVFHESNSIVALRAHRNRFSAFHLPQGAKATLLVVGLKDGQFFLFKSFIEKINSELKKAPLKEISEKDLRITLENMIF